MRDRKLTAPEMGRLTPEEYRSRPQGGLAVVLDNVRSAYNVGSAFRTSDAFGIDRIWLCGICATPPSAEIHKTALGAEDAVPWEHSRSTLETVRQLKADGWMVAAVEQTEKSIKLDGAWQCGPLPARYAFVFGNEVEGVRQEVVDECDFTLEIPQRGTKHSLNVAETIGIVLFEATKSRP